MRNLKDYINEGLLNRKVSIKTPIKYKPETKLELKDIVFDLLRNGISDLNCIDVSNITDMSYLFGNLVDRFNLSIKNIDVSEWDVSNVTNMNSMFYGCRTFTSDLSKWDVSNVEDMQDMFCGCVDFVSDLSKWKVSNCKGITDMFRGCTSLKKNNKIPDWYNGQV